MSSTCSKHGLVNFHAFYGPFTRVKAKTKAIFYRKATKLGKGNVFTGVYLFTGGYDWSQVPSGDISRGLGTHPFRKVHPLY